MKTQIKHRYRGVARIFQRGGGGGHTVSNIIVMAFSPRNIVGCLLKKGLQRGGHGHPRTPLATPLQVSGLERGKTRVTKSRLVLDLHLIS